jgi:NitT/TauT family transport system substrate-binding protein
MRVSRAAFLSAASAAATVTLFPRRPARAAGVVRIGSLESQNSAEAYYAQELGLYAKAGLSVEINTFQSGAASSSALAGGAIDIGISDALSLASAHSHGIQLIYIAPASISTKSNPAYVVMVPSASPIATAKDFDGKTIGVNGIKNVLQIPTEAWIDNNGGDSKTVKFVEMPFPALGPAMLAGRIDGGLVSEPFITANLDTGKIRVISLAEKSIAPEFMYSGWATTPDWANKNPDAVRKLVSVFSDTAKWANSHLPESAQMLVRITKMEPDVANKMIRVRYGERLNAALLQPVIDAAAKYGAIPKPFPAAEVFSPVALR